jgi:hypothetical protein
MAAGIRDARYQNAGTAPPNHAIRRNTRHRTGTDSAPTNRRCWRLSDITGIFLGLTTYSLQNHLRTTVKGIGQIEIDELYIGIDKRGCHYVIPVQAKSGKDQIGVVQTTQDIRYAEQKFPGMQCRAIAAQFTKDGVIALFELMLHDQTVKIVEERHYQLVPADKLDSDAIRKYRESA